MISRLFVWLCVRWFRWSGWVIAKNVPKDLKNYVLVAAPHTSNVDFFVGVAAREVMGLETKFLAKRELFTFPIRHLLLNLGGHPVDRSKKSSLVDTMAESFKTEKNFSICVAPEGTRSKVQTVKSGFYHIAQEANVPIVLVAFDYGKKCVTTSDPFLPSGDLESDLEKMFKFFRNITPKNPENFGL